MGSQVTVSLALGFLVFVKSPGKIIATVGWSKSPPIFPLCFKTCSPFLLHLGLRTKKLSEQEGNKQTGKQSSVFFSTLTHHLSQRPKTNCLQLPHYSSNLQEETGNLLIRQLIDTLWSGIYLSTSQLWTGVGVILHQSAVQSVPRGHSQRAGALRKPYSLDSDTAQTSAVISFILCVIFLTLTLK